MDKKEEYPSILQQGKNLAQFSWDLINHIQKNHDKYLFVSDETYKERMTICKTCDKYDEFENRCKECGCFLPAKAKIVLDSCPLNKWSADDKTWEDKFNNMISEMEEN